MVILEEVSETVALGIALNSVTTIMALEIIMEALGAITTPALGAIIIAVLGQITQCSETIMVDLDRTIVDLETKAALAPITLLEALEIIMEASEATKADLE